MAITLKRGSSLLSKSEKYSPLGAMAHSFFSTPLRLFFENGNATGNNMVTVTGYDADRQRVTEFVTIIDIDRAFTKNAYIYVESIELSQHSNDGFTVHCTTENGMSIGSVSITDAKLTAPRCYVVTENTKILEYGVSAWEKESHTPILVQLVAYDEGGRTVLHAMYAKTDGSISEKTFTELPVIVGSLISLEAKTEGSDAFVESWIVVES